MDALHDVMTAFDAIGRELDGTDLEPNPRRDDWDSQVDRLDELRATLDREVLGKLDEAVAILATESPVAEGNLRNNVAHVVAELAAVHQAAGRKTEASALFAKALRAGASEDLRAELEAASREPETFVELALGRWHHRSGDFAAGDRVLGSGKRAASDPALRKAFDRSLDGPRPMGGSAPALMRINGIGVGLYGDRDRRPDGSYIATHCFCVLFVPLIALGAYRVINQGNGLYTFLAKERLSPFARGWNWSLLAMLGLAIAGSAVSSYLDSPARRAQIALEDAQAIEATGDVDRAADAYQRVVDEHSQPVATIAEASTGLVRVLVGRVEAPMTPARVDEGARIVRRYQSLPQHAQGGAAASLLSRSLGAWADQIGDSDEAARGAALRLVELGCEVAQGPDQSALRERAAALHMAIAEPLRAEWPLEALQHYVRAASPEAMSAATSIVGELHASVLPDVEADVHAWEARADANDAAAIHVRDLRAQLLEWEGDARRRQALESGDAETLAQLHRDQPDDQEVGASLADARRGAGEIDEALAILSAYGTPGQISAHAQRSLASCYAERGELERADALLTRQIGSRLPAFQEAQRAFDAASEARIEALVSRARAGLDQGLNLQLENVHDDQHARELFDRWLREQLEADQSLAGLREAYTAQAGVVPTVLSLGTIKLRRAQEEGGAVREQLLEEAERLFLSIRQEAEGVPGYHLSLGQVYHRLGRAEEGDAELRGVLESGDLALALEVARVYRELGLVERAREVANDVFERGTGADGTELRAGAAQLMANLATNLDDRESWLRRAPQDSFAVRTALLDVRAQRAFEERNLREADRLFAQVAQNYAEEGANSSAALNNAALADEQRYLCTGDPSHLDRAGSRMERAIVLLPDNAVLIGNYAEIEHYRGEVAALDGFVRTSALRLAPYEAQLLVSWLGDGPSGDAIRAALRAEGRTRHARELTRQEETLAPQRPHAWDRERGWASLDRDEEALRALLGRLQGIENVDTSDRDGERSRQPTDAQQVRRRAEIDASVTAATAVVEAVRRGRHAPTLAAALHLQAGSFISRAMETKSLEDAARAVAIAREAVATWDGFGPGQLPWALATQALVETMAARPSLRETVDARHRELSLVFLLDAGARQSAEVRSAFEASPLLDEACALRMQLPAEELGLDDRAMARIASHPGLEEAARPVASRERTRLSLDISERLDPHDPELPARRALLGG